MTKDEALDLALEALGQLWLLGDEAAVIANPAITAVKQARALDKKAENARELGLDYEPVWCGHCNGSGRMVRDPDIGTDQECFVCDGAGVPAAPVQEPVANAKAIAECLAVLQPLVKGRFPQEQALEELAGYLTIPPAQPAPVQEPMAWVDVDENGTMYSLRYWSEPDNRNEVALYRAPPNVATPQPAPVQEPVANLTVEDGRVAMAVKILPDGVYDLYTTPPAAPVQEPYKSMSEHISQATSGRVCIDPITGDVGIGTPAAQPAPVQEPVAWVCYGAPGKRDIDFEEADIDGLPVGTLLYTTPPAAQRQPLTDEQIKQIYTEQTGSFIDDSPWALLDFARAIESAHGIKENNT